MNRDFLTEAFKSMNIINEEAFDVDMKGAEEAEDFLDKDEYELLTVIDDEAKDEEEIKTDYTGKVIIECNTCHSKLFKDKEDIKIEDDIVNKDEECPYCNSLDGYAIIGQIAPYEEKEEEVKETEVIEEAASVGEDLDKYQEWVDYDMKRYGKISDETNRDVKEAGLQIVKDKYGDYQVIAGKYDEKLAESKKPSKKFIKEQLKRNKKSLRERLEEISVKTDDNKIEVIEDEEGKVTVTSEPACEEHCEVIKEVPEEVKDEIIDNQKEDSEDVDVDIDEIDTDTFGDLTERYLKKTYGNVKCFECKSSKKNNNKIIVEGFITFNSGNKKATQFIFEGHSIDRKGKMKLIGENKQLSNGKKSFVIRGHQDNNKVVCESLNYRYSQNNKMIRGSIKNI